MPSLSIYIKVLLSLKRIQRKIHRQLVAFVIWLLFTPIFPITIFLMLHISTMGMNFEDRIAVKWWTLALTGVCLFLPTIWLARKYKKDLTDLGFWEGS